MQDELKKIAASYGMQVEKLKEFISEEEQDNMKNDLLLQKAVNFVMENSVEVEPEEPQEESADGAQDVQ